MKAVIALLLFISMVFASTVWVSDINSQITTEFIVVKNKVVVGTETGKVYAVSLASGQQSWDLMIGDYVEDIAVFKGDIVASTKDGKVVRIKDSGTLVWSTDLRELEMTNRTYGITPGTINLFVSTENGIFKVDSNGNPTSFYSELERFGKPVLNQNYLMVSMDEELLVFRLPGNEPIWRKRIGQIWESSPRLAIGKIIVGTLDNRIYAFEAVNGLEVWRVETNGWMMGAPLIEENTVFIGSNDKILYSIALSDGKVKWEGQAEKAIQSTPTLGYIETRPVVFAGSQDHHIYAFDQDTGEILWKWESKDWITNLLYHNGKLLAGSRDGSLYLHNLDRACTIFSPSLGTTVGKKDVKLQGFAFPQSPSTQVQISVNSGSWETVAQGGTWSHYLEPEQLREGSNLIQCMVVDPAGQQDEPFLFQLYKDSNLPLGQLVVSYPLEANVGDSINITVYDEDTFEIVEAYTLSYGEETHTGDSEGNVVLSFEDAITIDAIISKKGFNDAYISIDVKKPGDIMPILIPAAIGIIVVGAIAFFVYKKFIKPKPKTS